MSNHGPLTHTEVITIYEQHGDAVPTERILALIGQRDAFATEKEALAGTLRHYIAMLDMTDKMRLKAEAERDDLTAQLSEMGRQRDLAIQQAIDEETKHRKWTDDRELLAKDLAAARAELDDYRKAWSLLDEPGAELRHAHTAEEAARQFVATVGSLRAELAKATAEPDRIYALPEIRSQGERDDVPDCVEAFIDHVECIRTESERAGKDLGLAEGRLFAEAERDEARATSAQHEKALEAMRAKVEELEATQYACDEGADELRYERDQARRDLDALRSAIATHRAQKADDRCIEDDDRLYAALGDGIKCDRRVGDKGAMLRNCARFIERRCEAGGWPTYAAMEKALEATRAEYEGYREEARRHGDELRARCAMLTEAARNLMLGCESPRHLRVAVDTALRASDADVAEWLAGVKAEARLAGAQAVLPTLSDEASRALAAHDAQVEAKTLENCGCDKCKEALRAART